MTEFTNPEINIFKIPDYQDTSLNKIDNSYKKVVALNYLSIALLASIVFFAVLIMNQFSLMYIVFWIIFIIFLIICMVLNLKSIAFRGFAFRNHDIINSTGFVVKNISIVPNNRIQHISIHQGIFSRFFNLCSLKIFTASTGTSDISIKGLKYEDALRYKEFILNKINAETNA